MTPGCDGSGDLLAGLDDAQREALAERIDAALTWSLDDPYLSDLGEMATRGRRAVMAVLEGRTP